MKKQTLAVLLLTLSTSTCQAALAASNLGDFLIVPGNRIGRTHLGANGALELARLPKPMASDAGMSQTRTVWVSRTRGGRRGSTLFIHTVSNGALNVKPLNGVTIDLIRVTSPQFHTVSGLAAGSALAQIRRFRHVKAVSGESMIYDDKRYGIAFEFAKAPSLHSRCIAVLIHGRGVPQFANAQQVQELLQSSSLTK